MPLAKDLLHPSPEKEKRKHKKKRLVQSPNSHFMDVKCPGRSNVTTVFSQARTVVLCVGCSLFPASLWEGKQGLQKGVPLGRGNTKSNLNRNEWENIPIDKFWIIK
uniref:40S ribosomal protein S27-like n=1 Tax=Marmota marmota marmota TaxID=9994 RepID=A0A8C5YM28_MARMA